MTLSGFIAYSTALAVAAVIPGPQIVAIVAHALKSGYRRAAWATAGMVLGDVLYLATVLAGLAYIAETFSLLLIAIKWAGVACLCWLAYRFWTSRERLNIDEGEDTGRGTNAFISGVLVTIGNPKSILFYVSIVPTVLDLHEVTLLDGAVLVLLTALILSAAQFQFQFPFAIAGARARLSFQSLRMMRLFNRGAAIGLGARQSRSPLATECWGSHNHSKHCYSGAGESPGEHARISRLFVPGPPFSFSNFAYEVGGLANQRIAYEGYVGQ
ncbi:LysE family translocator [Rhizobium laguerreae]